MWLFKIVLLWKPKASLFRNRIGFWSMTGPIVYWYQYFLIYYKKTYQIYIWSSLAMLTMCRQWEDNSLAQVFGWFHIRSTRIILVSLIKCPQILTWICRCDRYFLLLFSCLDILLTTVFYFTKMSTTICLTNIKNLFPVFWQLHIGLGSKDLFSLCIGF